MMTYVITRAEALMAGGGRHGSALKRTNSAGNFLWLTIKTTTKPTPTLCWDFGEDRGCDWVSWLRGERQGRRGGTAWRSWISGVKRFMCWRRSALFPPFQWEAHECYLFSASTVSLGNAKTSPGKILPLKEKQRRWRGGVPGEVFS